MGAAKHGQLGTGTTKARVRSPKEVKSLDGGALFVSAGAQHTVALGADKQLYAWGTASQSKGGLLRRRLSSKPLDGAPGCQPTCNE